MFSSLRGLLVDVHGVLYESGTLFPIAGSVEALQNLRSSGIPFRLVSNESQCSTQKFLEKLHRIGFGDIQLNDIFLPAPAAIAHIKEQNLKPYIVCHPDLEPEFTEFRELPDEDRNCVLIGDAANHFTFQRMNKAFNLLMKAKQPHILSLGYGRFYKHGNQLNLDVGPFVEALKFAVGPDRLQTSLFGKPSPDYFNAATNDMKLENSTVAMIGDDVNSDIGGAKRCGLQGLLVRTGKYTQGDEIGKEFAPDLVVDNFANAVDLVLKEYNGGNRK